MKRLLIALGMVLVLGTSSSFVCLAAEPTGSDTLADWEIKVPSYPNTIAVLNGEDGNYYIYPGGEQGIPYVMLHAYEGFDSADDFLLDFTSDVMAEHYPDLEILSDIALVIIDGQKYYEIDYTYSVSGYVCVDRRIARTVGDLTYMFASKEIPELDLTVGTLLEDTISDSVFLALGDDLSAPEPTPGPSDSDIPEFVWTDDMAEALEEEGIYGSFYIFDEVDAMVWIPDILEPLQLGAEDKEQGYIAYFVNSDWSFQIGVQYVPVNRTQEEYLAFIQEQPQVETIQEFLINDIPFIYYDIPENDVVVLSTVTNSGYAMEFSFFPVSGQEFADYIDIIGTSIQPEK